MTMAYAYTFDTDNCNAAYTDATYHQDFLERYHLQQYGNNPAITVSIRNTVLPPPPPTYICNAPFSLATQAENLQSMNMNRERIRQWVLSQAAAKLSLPQHNNKFNQKQPPNQQALKAGDCAGVCPTKQNCPSIENQLQEELNTSPFSKLFQI